VTPRATTTRFGRAVNYICTLTALKVSILDTHPTTHVVGSRRVSHFVELADWTPGLRRESRVTGETPGTGAFIHVFFAELTSTVELLEVFLFDVHTGRITKGGS
jgi:hypothetical protein